LFNEKKGKIMDDKNSIQFQWDLLIKWVAATTVAFVINDLSQFFIPNQSIASFLYLIFVEGFVIGMFQWLFVLWFLTPKAHLWILYSTIGYGTGWFLGSLLARVLLEAGWLVGNPLGATLIAVFIHGTVLGIIQWAFFIRKLYSKSFFWILANAIGLPLAFGLSWFVIIPGVFGDYDSPLIGVLDSALRGILFSGLTGATLILMSRHPQGQIHTSALEAQ
jgi:hypothetical protein